MNEHIDINIIEKAIHLQFIYSYFNLFYKIERKKNCYKCNIVPYCLNLVVNTEHV